MTVEGGMGEARNAKLEVAMRGFQERMTEEEKGSG